MPITLARLRHHAVMSTRRRLVFGASAALLLVAAACQSESAHGTRKSTTSAAAARLEVLLLRNVPDDYRRQPDDVADTGPADFDKAVRDEPSDLRRLLTEDDFVAGSQRYWTSGAENEIVEILHQFTNAAAANAFAERHAPGTAVDASKPLTRFAVFGVPGSKGVSAHVEGRDRVVVVFTRGAYAVRLFIFGRGDDQVV